MMPDHGSFVLHRNCRAHVETRGFFLRVGAAIASCLHSLKPHPLLPPYQQRGRLRRRKGGERKVHVIVHVYYTCMRVRCV